MKGKRKMVPIFQNELLSSTNTIKSYDKYPPPTKQDEICDYNPIWFLSICLMLDDIIMDTFRNKEDNAGKLEINYFFSKIKHDNIYLYKVHFKTIHTKNRNTNNMFIVGSKNKNSLLFIFSDEKDIINMFEQWFFHINDFHDKHAICRSNNTIKNIF